MAKSSGSPRRTNFQHAALAQYSFSTEKPPEDSISWKLWLACQEIAQEALASKYIQGIKNGNLDPNSYGQYSIQDAAYCHNAQKDYQTIEDRAKADGFPELAAFAQARYESYQSYTEGVVEAWHLASAGAVNPGQAAQTYIDFEHHAANDLPSIYGVIAMIPCDELWPWLATELKPNVSSGNLYSFWIKENDDWHGAYRLDNFIDSWFAAHPDVYNWDTALYVMQSCMTCEANFFRSACGQKLLPMPTKPSSAAS